MVKSLEGNRLNMKLQELSKKNEHALICYVVAGYADMTTTEEIVSSLVSAPADIICFAKGHRPDKCLKISKNIRKISRSTNSYYDLFKYFTKSRLWKFYDTIESGIDGFILPDMAIEESKYLCRRGIKTWSYEISSIS